MNFIQNSTTVIKTIEPHQTNNDQINARTQAIQVNHRNKE